MLLNFKQKDEVSSLLKRLQEDLKEMRQQVLEARLAKWYQENNVEREKIKSYAYMFRLADETQCPLEVEDERNNIGGRILDDIEDGKLGYWCRRQDEIVKRKIYELKYGTSPNDVSEIGRSQDNHNKRRRLFERLIYNAIFHWIRGCCLEQHFSFEYLFDVHPHCFALVSNPMY